MSAISTEQLTSYAFDETRMAIPTRVSAPIDRALLAVVRWSGRPGQLGLGRRRRRMDVDHEIRLERARRP